MPDDPGGIGPLNSLGDFAIFGGYVADSVDHAFGGSSHLATTLELKFDPALSAMAQARGTPAEQATSDDVQANVTTAEDQTLADQAAQLKAAGDKGLKALLAGLHWLPWVVGGVVAVGLVAAVGYTARAFK
jgi:hypothetical protein